MTVKYTPRHDFVVMKIVEIGVTKGGLAIPQISAEGKKLVIHAMGPDVKNLELGDAVEVVGVMGKDIVKLPNERDMFLTRQANIAVVITEEIES